MDVAPEDFRRAYKIAWYWRNNAKRPRALALTRKADGGYQVTRLLVAPNRDKPRTLVTGVGVEIEWPRPYGGQPKADAQPFNRDLPTPVRGV